MFVVAALQVRLLDGCLRFLNIFIYSWLMKKKRQPLELYCWMVLVSICAVLVFVFIQSL